MPDKIVITGGSCSGKTSAKAYLMQKLQELGISIVFVPEAATTFFSNGVDFSELIRRGNVDSFQRELFSMQLSHEDIFSKVAELQGCDLALLDRGALDGLAYVDQQAFDGFCAYHGLSMANVRNRYKAVIHLVTAADGAEKYYNFDNPARMESPEQARVLDKKIQQAWSGHPDMRIVANIRNGAPIDFGQKMDLLLGEVLSIIGNPIPVQTQRKFLLSSKTEPGDLPVLSTKIQITQSYFPYKEGEGTERRVRKYMDSKGDSLYFYTEKSPNPESGFSRFKVERSITAYQYMQMLSPPMKTIGQVSKRRYCFPWKNQYFQVDFIAYPEPLVLLEVQTTQDQPEILIPEFLKVVREVTEEPLYANAKIATRECPGY